MSEAFLLVRSEGRRVGLAVAQLVAVAESGETVAVPASEPALAGVGTIRGETLPVIRLGALLGGAAARRGDVAVLVRVDGVGICIEVEEAETVVEAVVMPLPEDAATVWARGVIRHEGGYVPILDLGALGARLFETGRA